MLNQLLSQNHSITLEQIKNFLYVYELESISLAATMCHKTQPAISHNISQLEKKLNTKLIQRNRGKKISFTEEGHRFYKKVSPLIGQLLTQMDEIENKKTISIGICDDLSVDIQMEIYNEVNKKHPDRIRLLCDFSHRISKMVSDGRLSFAIVKKTASDEDNMANSFYWVSPKKIAFEEQEKLALVSAHQGCFIRNILEQTLHKSEKSFYFSYIANHLASQAEAVNAGFGIGVLDMRWIKKYPDLTILDKENGFPVLPSFKYECIGSADTASKKHVQDILYHIVNTLNNT